MSKEQYARLTEAAKNVACANYLGISPKEFDEYNAEHTQARNFAMQEIRARAIELASARQAEAARAQALASEIGTLDAEYRAKDPEFFAKHESLMRDYLERMPHRAATEAIRAIQAGDAAGIRQFVSAVYGDYKNKKGGNPPAPAQRAKPAPPPVMKASGAGEASSGSGFADAGALADMTPDEQAEWLIANKFAG
jgi:hypothetical protein